jgi:hypothetical protein
MFTGVLLAMLLLKPADPRLRGRRERKKLQADRSRVMGRQAVIFHTWGLYTQWNNPAI